jgi:hypothetical protein
MTLYELKVTFDTEKMNNKSLEDVREGLHALLETDFNPCKLYEIALTEIK